VSGEVVLEFSSNSSRHLQVLFSIQEEEKNGGGVVETGFRRATEDGGGFNLIIPLVAGEESAAFSWEESSVFSYGTMLVASAVTAMGVSVLLLWHQMRSL
jgi:hypothetical protein